MSEKELLIEKINNLPEYKYKYILDYIENLEELEDDLYCEGLLRRYLDSDDNEESIGLEDYAKQNGIALWKNIK